MEIKSQLSDTHILKESLKHPWMFGMLIDRYQEAFLRKGIYILHSQDDAEDVVQDTFIKIYKHAHQFVEKGNVGFQSWAYKILMNTCYSYAYKKSRSFNRTKQMDFSDLDVSGGIEFFSDKEQTSFVQSVLTRLPQRLSRLLFLYFFEEKSYKEIAVMENLSLSAVRSGLYRARRQFKYLVFKMV